MASSSSLAVLPNQGITRQHHNATQECCWGQEHLSVGSNKSNKTEQASLHGMLEKCNGSFEKCKTAQNVCQKWAVLVHLLFIHANVPVKTTKRWLSKTCNNYENNADFKFTMCQSHVALFSSCASYRWLTGRNGCGGFPGLQTQWCEKFHICVFSCHVPVKNTAILPE